MKPSSLPLTQAQISVLLHEGHAGRFDHAASSVSPLAGRAGETPAIRTGSGLDYAETRPYQAGDDPRHMNWRASARSQGMGQGLFVRRYHQDIHPSSCFAVDRSASMRFGSRTRLKYTQGIRLALWLAAHDERQGAEIAALTMDTKQQWLPPRAGARSLHGLSELLNQPVPPISKQHTNWSQACDTLAQCLNPGSRIYLISDFLALNEREEKLLRNLAAQFNTYALVIYDELESKLPPEGPLAIHWGQSEQLVDGRSRSARAQHAQAWQQHRARLLKTFQQSGISARFIPAAEDDLSRLFMSAQESP